jgi:hypothetical protein
MRWGIAACPPSGAGGNWAMSAGVGKVATAGSANAPTNGEASTVVRSVGVIRGVVGAEHVQAWLPSDFPASSVDLWQQPAVDGAVSVFTAWQQVPNSVPPWLHARSGWGAASAATRARNSNVLVRNCIVRPMEVLRGPRRQGSHGKMPGNGGRRRAGTFQLQRWNGQCRAGCGELPA